MDEARPNVHLDLRATVKIRRLSPCSKAVLLLPGLSSLPSSAVWVVKLQAQKIIESDLAEIIDDQSMASIPVKTDQIIKDLLLKTNAKIESAVTKQKKLHEQNIKLKRGRRNAKGG